MAAIFAKIHNKVPVVEVSRPSMEDSLVRSIPEERFREEDLVITLYCFIMSSDVGLSLAVLLIVIGWQILRMLLNGQWHFRRVILTRDQISFTFVDEGEEQEIDYIPLHEIDYIKEMKDLPNADTLGTDNDSGELHAIQIATWKDGHNAGRIYYLRADCNDVCVRFMDKLRDNCKVARQKAEAHSALQRIQRKVLKIYVSDPFQFTVAALITANFIFTIIETQEVDSLVNPDGTPSPLATTLNNLNQAFTYIFTIELAINAFSHGFYPFIRNAWNIIDVVVVAVSILSIAITNQSTGIVRIMRALRVVRLFGRLKALKKIITALSLAILPVLNVFLILFLLLSIGAIVAVTLFRDLDPEDFSVFTVAFFTLFQVTAGEPWPSTLPAYNSDGSLNWTVKIFTTLYVIIVIWVTLQVSVAVLLDNFIGASTQLSNEERLKQAEQKQREIQLKNPLEPLLMKLAREFTDSQDLSDRLLRLYAALDTDRSGGLDSQELCAAMRKLEFQPRIHVSDSDFDSITQNGELCDERGQLGPKEFENVMRQQIRHMAQSQLALITQFDGWQSRLALITEIRSPEESDFMLHGTLKMIFMEQTRTEKALEQASRDLRKVITFLGCATHASDGAGADDQRRASSNPIMTSYRRRKSQQGLQGGSASDASQLGHKSLGGASEVIGENHQIRNGGENASNGNGGQNAVNGMQQTPGPNQSNMDRSIDFGSFRTQSPIKESCQPTGPEEIISFSLRSFAAKIEKKLDELASTLIDPLRRDVSDIRALLAQPSTAAFINITTATATVNRPRVLVEKHDCLSARRLRKSFSKRTSPCARVRTENEPGNQEVDSLAKVCSCRASGLIPCTKCPNLASGRSVCEPPRAHTAIAPVTSTNMVGRESGGSSVVEEGCQGSIQQGGTWPSRKSIGNSESRTERAGDKLEKIEKSRQAKFMHLAHQNGMCGVEITPVTSMAEQRNHSATSQEITQASSLQAENTLDFSAHAGCTSKRGSVVDATPNAHSNHGGEDGIHRVRLQSGIWAAGGSVSEVRRNPRYETLHTTHQSSKSQDRSSVYEKDNISGSVSTSDPSYIYFEKITATSRSTDPEYAPRVPYRRRSQQSLDSPSSETVSAEGSLGFAHHVKV